MQETSQVQSTEIPSRYSTQPNTGAWQAVQRTLLAHRPVAFLTGVYFLLYMAYVTLFDLGQYSSMSILGSAGALMLFVTVSFFFIVYSIRVQLEDKPEHLLPRVATRLKDEFFSIDRMLGAASVIFAFFFLLTIFANFKRMIPMVVPFYLDSLFYELDKTLHFGIDPWRILQPIFGYAPISFFINFLYNIWLFLLLSVFYWQAFAARDKQLRMQFILSFFACWTLLGTLAATLMSSAGPCYYGDLVPGQNPYAPLMEYLYQANESWPIWALQVQETLLENYRQSNVAVASGISAMPSVHVAIAWLMMLLAWRTNRTMGIIFTVYCAFIMVGSVHLAWHYAVDGYISAILTTLIWWACGHISRLSQNRS